MVSKQDARKWSEDFFEVVDRGDADGIAARVAEGVVMTSGNGEPVVGRDALHAMIRHFRTTIDTLSHEIVQVWHVPEGVIAELQVTYGRLDGTTLTLPCTNIFHIDDEGLVTDYKIFMDMNPVYA